MNYIMINEGKMKIMLEAQDLEEWDIQIDELDYSNPYAKAIFEEILAYAKEHFGFETTGYRVLLQLYPSKDGGCELFITRLGESIGNQDQIRANTEQRAYSFEKLSYLISVCRRLCRNGFEGFSSAWFDNDGKWFLMISPKDSENSELCHIDKFTFITEYGECESPNMLPLYLNEYAVPVCEGNAALILGKI